MSPGLRTFVKQAAILCIGVACVAAACGMLWLIMTPERAGRLDTWAAIALLGLFVLPITTGGLLLHEHQHRASRAKTRAMLRARRAARLS